MDSNHIIFERLDRFMGNMKWRMIFPAARVISLEFYHSDHIPNFLKLHDDMLQNRSKTGNRELTFRFEKRWLMEDECMEVIERGWGSRDLDVPILERIASCKSSLISWDAKKLRRLPKRLKSKRAHLNKLRISAQ